MSRLPGCFLLSLFLCWTQALADESDQRTAPPPGGITLTLQEAIKLAVSRAPEVSIADVQVTRAGDFLRETRASNRPQVIAGTGLAYNNGYPLSIEGAAPSAFQIGLTQPVFNRRNKNLILEAEEGIKATRIGSERRFFQHSAPARTILFSDVSPPIGGWLVWRPRGGFAVDSFRPRWAKCRNAL